MLTKINHHTKLNNHLESFCDIILSTATEHPTDQRFYTIAPYTIFAIDGSGGTFGFIGEVTSDAPIGYISSEGACGRIADNLHDFFSLVTFYPYMWQDAIQYTRLHGERGLAEYLAQYEREIRGDRPDYDEVQSWIAHELDLHHSEQIIPNLMQSLTTTPSFLAYCAEDDQPYEQL